MSYDVIYYGIIFMIVAVSTTAWYLHKHDIRPLFFRLILKNMI